MTIYIDVILFENICMNYIILFATGLINKVNIKQIRIITASFIGSVYAVLSFMSILEVYSSFILKIILSVVMIYIALKPKNLKILLKQLLIFYLVSFAFGGCAFALLYFIRPQDILMKNGLLTGTYPIKIALLGGIVGFVIVNIAFKIVKTRISKKDMFCEITIIIDDKKACIKALIDSGNLLKDPISAMPVIVVEASSLKEVIPQEIINNLSKIVGGENYEMIQNMSQKYISKFRVIPFSSLGKQNGLLLGFKADKIIVSSQENEKELQDIIVGIYDKNLTKNGLYTGLIGLEILERCEDNEYFASIKK